MDYLERNQLIVAEIGRNLRIQRTGHTAYSERTAFTPVGSYYSQVLREELFAGLKEGSLPEWRVFHDLAFMRSLEGKFPHLVPELPIFYGLLRNREGAPLGVIMEDFSKGSKHKVHDVYEDGKNLPGELRDLVGTPNLSNVELAKVCFMVEGCRRLGDFDSIRSGLSVPELIERFPFADLEEQLERYTLQIDYDLK